eukprot:9405675-Karenia_brevis.AAC.1
MQHPTVCKVGVARMRPHRALAAGVAAFLKRTRAEIDLERTVPELLKGPAGARPGAVGPGEDTTEARLDVVAHYP